MYSISTEVFTSAFSTSAGIPSGPATFSFFLCAIAFFISSLVGLLNSIGKSVSAGWMVDSAVLVC